MNEFDQFVKHELKVKNYARYTDDFIIIADRVSFLKELLPKLCIFLSEKLKLELHPKKVTIKKHHQGVDFPGYVLLPYHIKLRTKTRNRITRKLREHIIKYKNGEIVEAKFHASLQSYLGVMSHADAYELSQDILNACWFLFKQ